MFGILIKRYCPVCEKETKMEESVGYNVDGKHYFPNCFCYKCNTDLSKEDRQVLREAKKNGKSIGVTMF